MDIIENFKYTDIGIIPNDWEIKTLRDLTNLITNGFVGKAKLHYTKSGEGVMYLQGFNVENNSFNLSGIKYVTQEFHKKNSKSCLQKDDLLTIQTGDIGLTSIVPEKFAGSNCHALIISRFKKHISSPMFYCQYFNSRFGRNRFKSIETGSTMKHLNVYDLAVFQLPVPPLTEQQAIAETLSDVDELITSLEALIAKKRAIKQGVMQELLTGRRRLPGFINKWKKVKLGELGCCLRGVSYQGESDLYEVENNLSVRLMRSNNIQNGTCDYSDLQFVTKHRVKQDQYLQHNDIIICMANGSKQLVGKTAIYKVEDTNKYTFGAFLGCFRTDSNMANSDFLSNYFLSYQYRCFIDILLSGSSINNLTPINLESIDLVVPDIDEQNEIANIFIELDSEISIFEKEASKYKLLKQGMMQELLTGRIRLKGG